MLERTKLLIVDDLPENLRALQALLRDEQRTVYQAGSGDEALALLLEHDFALAILDVQMPGMDGFELAELMRGTEKTRHIPIVFVSAAGRELNYAFKGYEAGAVDFLYKPLDGDMVRSKVNVFVALHRQRQETQRQVVALEKARAEQEATLQALHLAQQELQRALRTRDEFMSLVAHELRTPLNTLSLETQLRKLQIERGMQEGFNPEVWKKMVARDDRQIQSMIRLIDDMLDVSRIRSGKLSIRPAETELAGLLQRVVADMSHQAGETGCEISLKAEYEVRGYWDEFRIEQVIVNLLTNALRYGCGTPVEVRLEADWRAAQITVRDGGQGIAAETQDRIFEPFERGQDTGVSAGLGLGLYISRQLAEAHRGTLSVHSAPGDGATFTLTLPRTSS